LRDLESRGIQKLLDPGGSSQANPQWPALRFDDELHSEKGATAALKENPFEGVTGHFGFGRKAERIAILEFNELRRKRADPGSKLGAHCALSCRESAEIARDRWIGRLCHEGLPETGRSRRCVGLPPALAGSAATDLGRQSQLSKGIFRKPVCTRSS
jgi:hypothetical protein